MSNYETDSYSSSSSSRNSNGKKLTQKLKRFSTFISKKIKTKLNTTTTTTTTNPCSSSLTATDIKDIDPLVEIKQEPSNMQKDKSHFKKRHSSYISSCTKTPPLSNTTPRSYFSSIELKNNNNNNNTSNGSYNKDILKEQYYYDKNDNHDLDHLLSSSLSPPPRSQINKSKSTLITSGRKSTDDAGCVNQRHKPSLCRSNTLGTYYQYYHQYHRAKHLARPVSHSSENSDRYVDDGNTSVMTSATSFTTTTLTAVATPQTSTAAAHVLL